MAKKVKRLNSAKSEAAAERRQDKDPVIWEKVVSGKGEIVEVMLENGQIQEGAIFNWFPDGSLLYMAFGGKEDFVFKFVQAAWWRFPDGVRARGPGFGGWRKPPKPAAPPLKPPPPPPPDQWKDRK